MSAGGSWIHKKDLIGEEAVDIKRRRMSHCIIHAGQVIPLTHYRCEARLWVHKKIVGNGERELMTIPAELQEERRFDVGVLANECLISIRVIKLDPSSDRKALGRVQDGRSNVGVAARGTRKIQGVRTNDTSRPPCSAEQRSRVIANRISS